MDLDIFPILIPPPPLYLIPLGLPSAPGPSTCLMHLNNFELVIVIWILLPDKINFEGNFARLLLKGVLSRASRYPLGRVN